MHWHPQMGFSDHAMPTTGEQAVGGARGGAISQADTTDERRRRHDARGFQDYGEQLTQLTHQDVRPHRESVART